jgi:vitamin B12 transporter
MLLGVALVLTAQEPAAFADNPGERREADSTRVQARGDDVLVRGQASEASGFVSRARIEDSPREVTDAASLVEPLPGVHVRRLGADDSFATLSIRGSSSTQVAVYLAGVPLSGGADPTLDLATLPLWPGARAVVHRTFAPAALGRGSLGGTLVIDPPSPRSPVRTDVWTAAGSFGSMRLRVGDVRGDPDGVRIATGLSASRSDDDFTFLDKNRTLAGGEDVFTTRQNAGHASVAGLASVGIPVRVGSTADGGHLTITSLAQARRQELPGSSSYPSGYLRLDSSRLLSALELTLPVGAHPASGAFVVRGWGRRDNLAIRDTPISSLRVAPGSPLSTDDAILAAGGSAGWRGRPTETTNIELRVDGSAERFAPGSWVGRGAVAPASARRTNAGVAFDANTRLAGALMIAGSARADSWFDTSEDGPSSSEVRPTGNVGVELPLGPVVAASHAGFVARPASFVERFGNRGGFIGEKPGGPRLKPESAFTVDAGGRITRRVGPVSLHVEASAFATWAEDLITFIQQGFYRRLVSTNIGRARLLGIEAAVQASAFAFDARVSQTALATSNLTRCESGPGCERPPLQGRPAQDFVADLSWTRGPLRLRYGVDFVSGIQVNEEGGATIPARILHGAGLHLAIPRVPGLSMALDVRNLFDLRVAEYQGVGGGTVRAPIGDLFDYPLPGRRVLVSLRWTTSADETTRARRERGD